MRINKYLADSGVASRRASEELISSGKVKVNGKVVTTLSAQISETDSVTVEGSPIRPTKKQYYIMLHKPKGYVTTVKDDLDRKTVMDLIDIKARLFPVGRLDYDTEGLLILTNDGSIANVLTHPKNKIPKTYLLRISGKLSEEERKTLQEGVVIEGKPTSPAIVHIIEGDAHKTKLEVTIFEGRNHQIKNMFAVMGKEVEFLKRTSIGEIRLGGLTRGTYRDLNAKEIAYLKSLL
ncbi:MAG: pseudouridine synthase [Clostridia bacterium]